MTDHQHPTAKPEDASAADVRCPTCLADPMRECVTSTGYATRTHATRFAEAGVAEDFQSRNRAHEDFSRAALDRRLALTAKPEGEGAPVDDLTYALAALRAAKSTLNGMGATHGGRIGMVEEAIRRLSASPPVPAVAGEPANCNDPRGLVVEVVKDQDGRWLVEAVDEGSEGEIYRATFDGHTAEECARRYAQGLTSTSTSSRPTPSADQSGAIGALVEALESIKALGDDGEHSGDRHARCRDIARQALAAYAASIGGKS